MENFSNSEAAHYICSTPLTLKTSRCTGTLFGRPAPSFLKLGKKVLYKKKTLDKWLSQFNEHSSTAESKAKGE